MNRFVFALLAALLIWAAHAYAAVTPITDLGIARIPATTGAAAIVALAALAYVVRRALRDMPPRRRTGGWGVAA